MVERWQLPRASIHAVRWYARCYLWLMPRAFVCAGRAAAAKARRDEECFREYVEQWDI